MIVSKIWDLREAFETTFAEASSITPDEAVGPVCRRCGITDRYERPRPLVFEWEPGSDIIGDFTWASRPRIVVKRSVYEKLANEFPGIRAERVEMAQDPKLRPPKRITRRTKPRIWLPYTGPELVELWPEHVVRCLPSSTLTVGTRCEVCGRESRRIEGAEVKAHLYDPDKGELVPDFQPRVPGKGLFVASSDVKDAPIFRMDEFTEAMWCTDEVKAFIQREGFTNVDFLEYGDVL